MTVGRKEELWEVLVPTVRRNDGRPIHTRFHKVWDKKVEAISGGLTILTPIGKGIWLHEGQTIRERMIPVRVMCTREQIEQIIDLTLEYYDQLAVMAYRVSDEVILKHRAARKGEKNV
jgi:hypothetical protein